MDPKQCLELHYCEKQKCKNAKLQTLQTLETLQICKKIQTTHMCKIGKCKNEKLQTNATYAKLQNYKMQNCKGTNFADNT